MKPEMYNNKVPYDLIIAGAGPAGMMCAYTAAQRGLKVAVVDSNRTPGRKLRITGKGRCNLTNNCDIKKFMENVPRNGKFLYSSVNAFPPSEEQMKNSKRSVKRGSEGFLFASGLTSTG